MRLIDGSYLLSSEILIVKSHLSLNGCQEYSNKVLSPSDTGPLGWVGLEVVVGHGSDVPEDSEDQPDGEVNHNGADDDPSPT